MSTALILASGLCWTATYLLIIWRGFVDQTYGMPLIALGANLAWEFIFSLLRPPAETAQHLVNLVWLCFDLVILFTVLRFGARQFPYLSRNAFYGGVAGILVLTYLGVDLVSREFDGGGPTYAAFAQNLMMSALFLGMLAARRSLAGQSVWVAVLKLAGTAFASVWVSQYGAHQGSSLLLYLYLAILAVDSLYVGAVIAVGRATERAAEPSTLNGAQSLSPAV